MRILGLSMALVALMAIAQPAMAGGCKEECCGTPNSCGHCGCAAPCKRMCKVVPDVKVVTKVVWEVKCEEFCTPFPGSPCCGHAKSCVQEGCDAGSCEKGKCPEVVTPDCGPVRTRKILVKKEIKVQCPTFKCVPCYGCDACCESGAVVPSPAGGKTAPAPAPAAPKATKQTAVPLSSATGVASIF